MSNARITSICAVSWNLAKVKKVTAHHRKNDMV